MRSVQVHDRAAEAGARRPARRRSTCAAPAARPSSAASSWWPPRRPRGPADRSFDAWPCVLLGVRPLARRAPAAAPRHRPHVARLRFSTAASWPPGGGGGRVVRLDGGRAAVEPDARFIVRSLSPGRPRRRRGARRRAAALARARRPAAFLRARRRRRRRRGRAAGGGRPRPRRSRGRRAGRGRHRPGRSGANLAALAGAGELETLGDGRPAQPGVRRRQRGHGRPRRPRPTERRFFAAGTLAGRGRIGALLGRRAAEHPENPFVALAGLAAAAPGFRSTSSPRGGGTGRRGDLVERDGGFALAGAATPSRLPTRRWRPASATAWRRRVSRRLARLARRGARRRRGATSLTVVLEVLTRRGLTVRVDRDLWFDEGCGRPEARERLQWRSRAFGRSPLPTIATRSGPVAATPRRCSSCSTARGSPAVAATPACCAGAAEPAARRLAQSCGLRSTRRPYAGRTRSVGFDGARAPRRRFWASGAGGESSESVRHKRRAGVRVKGLCSPD